jgi:hypothetical protein
MMMMMMMIIIITMRRRREEVVVVEGTSWVHRKSICESTTHRIRDNTAERDETPGPSLDEEILHCLVGVLHNQSKVPRARRWNANEEPSDWTLARKSLGPPLDLMGVRLQGARCDERWCLMSGGAWGWLHWH